MAACERPSSTRVIQSVGTATPGDCGITPVANDAALHPSNANISAVRTPARSPNSPAGTWNTV